MNPDQIAPKRILVVDDEQAIRETLRLLLRFDGHTVTEAADGHEACMIYAPKDFDLVITDYLMPEMNGDELARTIKTLVPTQPVLMLTAQPRIACTPENPVDAVLEKPFTLLALRQMLKALLSPDLRSSLAPTPAAKAGAEAGRV